VKLDRYGAAVLELCAEAVSVKGAGPTDPSVGNAGPTAVPGLRHE